MNFYYEIFFTLKSIYIIKIKKFVKRIKKKSVSYTIYMQWFCWYMFSLVKLHGKKMYTKKKCGHFVVC